MDPMLPQLVEPTPGELRLLSPAALRLWRLLVRLRNNGCDEGEWFGFELKKDYWRAKINSYGVAVNALARLKHAGLVETSRNSWSRYTRQGWVNANTTNNYLAVGSYKNDRGVYKIMFPRRAWAEYVAACRWGARRAAIRVKAWKYECPNVEWRAEWTTEILADIEAGRCGGSSKISKGLSGRSMGSVKTYNSNKKEALKRESLREFSPSKAEVEKAGRLISDAFSIDPVSSFRLGGCTLVRKPGRAQQMIPDPPLKPPQTILWMSSEIVPETKARLVVDGFRDAVWKVYGVRWWHYSQGDIRKAKHYDKLLACGEAMSDHSVPAEHFAIWRLTWFKNKVKSFAKKPPPIWLVMNAKWVSEKAGWFHKDYALPYATFKPDPIRTEQLLRNEESMLRHRNHPEPWLALPRGYVEKRIHEIEMGYESPFDLWPRRR